MIGREKISTYFDKHPKTINTLYVQNVAFLVVKIGGICSQYVTVGIKLGAGVFLHDQPLCNRYEFGSMCLMYTEMFIKACPALGRSQS
jgi:hypothetical protein